MILISYRTKVHFGIFVLFFYFNNTVNAQLLDNSRGLAFTDMPYFNTAFVKASKIKEIQGTYIFKKQGDIMRESKFVYVYNFDTLGNLVRQYQTAKGDLVTDTTVRFYDYTSDGRMVRKRISQKKGFLSTYYQYNEKGQVVKEEVYRDIDTTNSLLNPIIERSILWNTETMTYDNYQGQFKKITFNNYGNPYLEEYAYYDSLGYLKKEEKIYTITRNKQTTLYTYSDKGWIQKLSVYKNTDTIPLSESIFTYDAFGNMLSKLEYKNGVFTTEYQIVYSGLTGLLYSIIIREVSTNFISIIKFSEPSFYPTPIK
ncbi:MAG TPA: hypothetical protein PLI97_01925 [Fluviicola sp.]|nr:hypothetical protein [Fluviicola sp.]